MNLSQISLINHNCLTTSYLCVRCGVKKINKKLWKNGIILRGGWLVGFLYQMLFFTLKEIFIIIIFAYFLIFLPKQVSHNKQTTRTIFIKICLSHFYLFSFYLEGKHVSVERVRLDFAHVRRHVSFVGTSWSFLRIYRGTHTTIIISLCKTLCYVFGKIYIVKILMSVNILY